MALIVNVGRPVDLLLNSDKGHRGGVVRNSKPLKIGSCSYPPPNGIQFKKISTHSNRTAGDKVKGTHKGYISLIS